MKYELFLFDLDDTLLDFRQSERLSFFMALKELGIKDNLENLFVHYQIENNALWKLFEASKTTKEHLKVERFRRIFDTHKIEVDPHVASQRYLEALPETVVLINQAEEICEWLSKRGEIGIITNGMQSVQHKRIRNSKISRFISFIGVSEDCGYAKPDVRFFDYCARKAKRFSKDSTIIVGDRIETDILGAVNFGIDGCWFNPSEQKNSSGINPTFEIKCLSELKIILSEI